MNDKRFSYLIGLITLVSWVLYFLYYSFLYKSEKMIEGIIFIVIIVSLHMIITKIYFR